MLDYSVCSNTFIPQITNGFYSILRCEIVITTNMQLKIPLTIIIMYFIILLIRQKMVNLIILIINELNRSSDLRQKFL